MSNLLEVKPTYDGFFSTVLDQLSAGTRQQYQAALTDFEKWSIKKYGKNLTEIIPEIGKVSTNDQIIFLQSWINDSASAGRTKRQRSGFI